MAAHVVPPTAEGAADTPVLTVLFPGEPEVVNPWTLQLLRLLLGPNAEIRAGRTPAHKVRLQSMPRCCQSLPWCVWTV